MRLFRYLFFPIVNGLQGMGLLVGELSEFAQEAMASWFV
jgi:hypothetical protein